MSTVSRRLVLMLAALSMTSIDATAQEPYLASLFGNVVRVVDEESGFGIIVGARSGQLLIATARHTLGDAWDATPEVCFAPRGDVCQQAMVAYWADAVGDQPALDLVILAVADPGGLTWRPDAEASADAGDAVWVIGRSHQWWLSPRPGRVIGRDPDARHLVYQGLDVAQGVSGAPILTADGIAAMHLQASAAAQEARGLELAAIRQRVEDYVEGRWLLSPRADCAAAPSQFRGLAGRVVVVYLDGAEPDAALQAMIALGCVGARALPVIADTSAWPGNRVIYRSGDLQTARALQNLLSPVARIDTGLGEPAADAELWMR